MKIAASLQNPATLRAEVLRSSLARDGYAFSFAAISQGEAAALVTDILLTRARLGGSGMAETFGLMKPHLMFDWAHRLAQHPGPRGIAEAALSSQVALWSMDLFTLAPDASPTSREQIAFDWHQDSTYVNLVPIEGVVRLWIALTPVNEANGTLRFQPGSHTGGALRHVGISPAMDALHGERVCYPVDDASSVHVEMRPGECSIHHLDVVHASGHNRSGAERLAISMTFIADHVRPQVTDCAMMFDSDRNSAGTGFVTETPIDSLTEQERVEQYLEMVEMRTAALSFAAPRKTEQCG